MNVGPERRDLKIESLQQTMKATRLIQGVSKWGRQRNNHVLQGEQDHPNCRSNQNGYIEIVCYKDGTEQEDCWNKIEKKAQVTLAKQYQQIPGGKEHRPQRIKFYKKEQHKNSTKWRELIIATLTVVLVKLEYCEQY